MLIRRPMETIIVVWFVISLAIAVWGSRKQIGFIGTFIVSALLSPVAGVVFVLLSPRKLHTQEIHQDPQ